MRRVSMLAMILMTACGGAFTVPAAVTGALPAGFSHCGARLSRVRRASSGSVEVLVLGSDYFAVL